MTAIINELRPGLAWLVLASAGVLIAGVGLMLVVLPFTEPLASQDDLPDDLAGVFPNEVGCPTPIRSAFDDTPPPDDGGWVADGAGTDAVASGACVEPSQWRLGLGLGALAVGSAVGALAARRPRTAPA